MNSCSCLTLILACIIYWQAKHRSRRRCPRGLSQRKASTRPCSSTSARSNGQRHSLRPVRPRFAPGSVSNRFLCCIFTAIWSVPPITPEWCPVPTPFAATSTTAFFIRCDAFRLTVYCPDAACPVLLSMDFMEGLTRNSCASSASRLGPHQEDPDAGLENIQGVPFDAAYGVQADIEADSDGFEQHHVQPATVV